MPYPSQYLGRFLGKTEIVPGQTALQGLKLISPGLRVFIMQHSDIFGIVTSPDEEGFGFGIYLKQNDPGNEVNDDDVNINLFSSEDDDDDDDDTVGDSIHEISGTVIRFFLMFSLLR